MSSGKIKIIALSHAFIKKINLSFYETLAQKKRYSITCICPKKISLKNKHIYSDFNSYRGKIKIIKLNLKFKHSRLFYFENLIKYIKMNNPKYILIDNDTVSIQSILVIIYSFIYNYKIIYFVNENAITNIFDKHFIKKIVKFIFVFVINFLIKSKVNKLFCYSKQIKQNYDILGYKKKTKVMPLGYDEKIFNMNNRKIKKKFVISYFGRITREKGIHIFLKSLKNFEIKNWKLVIDTDFIEDKKYYNNLIRYLKKNFNKNNYSLIKSDHYKIADHMRYSDVVVLPSLHKEQYGRVIQESVACGNVAIGSNIGALPEIIKDKDLLFEPGNHDQLKKIIIKLTKKKFFKDKFKKLYKNILSGRTISKQIKIFEEGLIK